MGSKNLEKNIDKTDNDDDEEDYDRSLEYRQLARIVIIGGLVLFITGIFIYIMLFVN